MPLFASFGRRDVPLTTRSDILAELDLPQSGIQNVHGIDYPKGFVEQANFVHSDTPATMMMMYYSGQIHIRGILNHIQSNLHRPGSAFLLRSLDDGEACSPL